MRGGRRFEGYLSIFIPGSTLKDLGHMIYLKPWSRQIIEKQSIPGFVQSAQ